MPAFVFQVGGLALQLPKQCFYAYKPYVIFHNMKMPLKSCKSCLSPTIKTYLRRRTFQWCKQGKGMERKDARWPPEARKLNC